MVVTNRGLISASDAHDPENRLFRLRCNEAYDVKATYVPFVSLQAEAGSMMLVAPRAVLTSDDRIPTLDFLRRAGVDGLVDMVVGGDDVALPKPHPDGLMAVMDELGALPHRVLMVGDSTADRDAAGAAGTWFVAVGHDSPAARGADAAIDSVDVITAE